jgi:hypothetical protein
MSSWLYRNTKRDLISHNTIREGTILIVYPADRSHVSEPYKIKVVHVNENYFKTCMVDGSGHIAVFEFDSDVWKDYHHCRFEIYVF